MATLVELTAQIVASQAASSSMSSEELLKSLQSVHTMLKALEAGEAIPAEASAPTEVPASTMTVKQAFAKKDKVFCMICGKGFTTLKRHLTVAHGLKPAEYRKQFGIKSSQTLAAKSYVESRRQTAIDNNLGDGLAKARAIRAAGKKTAEAPVKKSTAAAKVKAPVPMKTIKAPVPAVKTKAGLTVVQKKAAVPAKTEKKPAAAKTTKAKK